MRIRSQTINAQPNLVACLFLVLLASLVGNAKGQHDDWLGIAAPPPLVGFRLLDDGESEAQNALPPALLDGEQDPFDLPLDQLAELKVVVDIASLFDESELVVGSTVARITRDDWQRRGARTLADALWHQPGTIVLDFIFGGKKLTVRGFAVNAPGGIAINMDGAPINGFGNGNAFFEIHSLNLGVFQEIQTVRGPGSALYGPDAFQGVVSLKTFESDKDVVELDEIGTDNYHHTTVRASHAITDNLRYSTAIAWTDQGGQSLDYAFTMPAPMSNEYENEFQSAMGIFKLHSDSEQDVSFRTGIYLNRLNADGFPANASNLTSGTDSDFVMINGGVTVKLPHDITLESDAFYWSTHRDRFRVGAPPLLRVIELDERRQGLNVILKQSTNALNTQWLIGYGYDDAKINKNSVRNTDAGGVTTFPPGLQEGLDRETHSFFAQAKTSSSDNRWHLLYGGRIDDFSTSGTHESPRLGVIHQPTPDSAIKLLYGHAFRPPLAAEQAGTPGTLGNPNLDPETIDTYEVVAMKQAEHWKASATLFYSEWEDVISVVTNTAAPPPNARDNTGSNRARGVEFSLQYIDDNFRADFSGSHVRAEDATNNDQLDAFPEWIFNIGVGCTCPSLNLDFYLVNRVHLGADAGPVVRATSGAVTSNPGSLKDYWRTDVTVTWAHPEKDFDVYVSVLNIFDRDNFTPSVFSNEVPIPDIGVTAVVGFRIAN